MRFYETVPRGEYILKKTNFMIIFETKARIQMFAFYLAHMLLGQRQLSCCPSCIKILYKQFNLTKTHLSQGITHGNCVSICFVCSS